MGGGEKMNAETALKIVIAVAEVMLEKLTKEKGQQ